MTLDDLIPSANESEPECAQPPVPEDTESATEASVPVAVQDEEPAAPDSPADPIPDPAPVQPPVHSAPAQPIYHTAPSQPVYHSSPVQPVYHTSPVQTPSAAATAPAAAPTRAKKAARAPRKKPPVGFRIVLQFLSFLLSFVMFIAVIAGVLLADLRQITSEDGIRKLISGLLIAPAQTQITVKPAPIQANLMSNAEDSTATTLPGDITVDEDGNISIGGDVSFNPNDIPADILNGGGSESTVMSLVDWFYDEIAASTDKPMKFSKQEMREFVQESTVSDYLSEKLAGYTDDFINDAEETEITTREVMRLLKENEDLMQDKLNMELTDAQWEEIEIAVDRMVVEKDINSTIRNKVYSAVDTVLEENADVLGGIDRKDIQSLLQTLTSDGLFFTVLGIAAAILLLLLLLNYYNPPAGLTWGAIPTMIAGLFLSLPILLIDTVTGAISNAIPAAANFVGLLSTFVNVFAPVHYTALGIGVALLVISIVWRIIRSALRKKHTA